MSIRLDAHGTHWFDQANALIEDLRFICGAAVSHFDHVGSTAIPGISAKPKPHIDAVMVQEKCASLLFDRLERLGYENLGSLYRHDVVRATVFMTDMDNYGAINEVYGGYWGDSSVPPACAAVEVNRCPAPSPMRLCSSGFP